MTRSLRINRHEWAIGLAVTTAKRGTCLRRQVGCVLLDEDGFVLATGYNGVASGLPHCNETDPGVVGHLRVVPIRDEATMTNLTFPNACPGAYAESGTNLDGCHAIHAEQNALLRMGDPRRVHSCYSTHSPCLTCVKLLMNTACQHIYFLEPYAHDLVAASLWADSRGLGTWIHMTPELMRKLEEHET